LGSAEGISGIVLLLEPLPFSELILPLDDDFDAHRINPTIPMQVQQSLLLFSNMKMLPLLLEVPLNQIPVFRKKLLSNEATNRW
jgi:hypothetical protein